MADFTNLNLEGANEKLNKALTDAKALKDNLLANHGGDASTILASLQSKVNDLVSSFADMIPELPSIPNINMQSEFSQLTNFDIGTPQYQSQVASITAQFGTAMNAKGLDIESLASQIQAGRERNVFVDASGNIFNGEVQRKVIGNEIKFFKGGNEDKDTSLQEEVFIKEYKYPLVETSPDKTEFILELDENLKGQEYRNDFVEMGEMIEYTPISKANSCLIKFDSKKPHILEFDIDDTDRGFTQNMVGGQIVIPNMYKITGEEDTTNSDVVPENTGNGTLQEQLEGGAATDFLDIDTEDLIQIMLNDPDPNERELADGALQERANEQR